MFNWQLDLFLKNKNTTCDIELLEDINKLDESNDVCQEYLNIIGENGYTSTINSEGSSEEAREA